ncbi:MAG: sulfur carrier protein ThiS [Victivallales bacterium]|nr:sulfur carrier protein ThiS [Victivallales bacterium]
MNLNINGRPGTFAEGSSLAEVLESLSIDPHSTLVSVNQEIVVSEDFGTTELQEDDDLDFFSFVGGG